MRQLRLQRIPVNPIFFIFLKYGVKKNVIPLREIALTDDS